MIQSRPTSESSAASSHGLGPVVMCAADDEYAIPLAVTLTSAAKHLAANRRLLVYLVDTGIQETNWNGLKESLANLPVDVVRISADVERIRHLRTSHHISHTAFVRLLAAELLPTQVSRVIYLDSDLLFRDDLDKLWNVELGDAILAAVPDIACPFVDARKAQCNFRRSSPYMATLAPIRNWRQLGLDPKAPYFNSGVMLIDLHAWRRERMADQFLRCLNDNEPYIWCWDQYALNVTLAGRWKVLPLRWNQGSHAFEYPAPQNSPVGLSEFHELMHNPAVIHFTTEFKPWRYGSRHPQRELYFQALKATAWDGWQPDKTNFCIRKAWQAAGVALNKRTTIAWRKINALVRSPQDSSLPMRIFPTAECSGLGSNVEIAAKP